MRFGLRKNAARSETAIRDPLPASQRPKAAPASIGAVPEKTPPRLALSLSGFAFSFDHQSYGRKRYSMKIAIFGLGYVGTVSAACLARDGHEVVGVDVNPQKVEMINDGRTPIIEPGLAGLIQAGVQAGRLRATTAAAEAVAATELALVCVSTPSRPNGDLDASYLDKVAAEIGAAIAAVHHRYTVVVRSTALPGTMRDRVIPLLEEAAGGRAGEDFGVCYHPEFLREGSAIDDYDDPPKIVIGAEDEASRAALERVCQGQGAQRFHTSIEEAEMLKDVDDCWHALKVAFANEFGRVCHAQGIDGRRIMSMFAQDTKLNVSAKYLRPGYAFGGSCLPKDLRAVGYLGRNRLDLSLPVLEAIMPSNEVQIEAGFKLIAEAGSRKVGLVGLSFKPETDDLRESPLVTLAERLIGKGYQLRIYDPAVNLAKLVGANRDYIERAIPHVSELLVPSLEALLDHAETVVIGHGADVAERLQGDLGTGKTVVDLVGLLWERRSDGDSYRGIGW
jgi:GDP-mannose 6-dehydrogenase